MLDDGLFSCVLNRLLAVVRRHDAVRRLFGLGRNGFWQIGVLDLGLLLLNRRRCHGRFSVRARRQVCRFIAGRGHFKPDLDRRRAHRIGLILRLHFGDREHDTADMKRQHDERRRDPEPPRRRMRVKIAHLRDSGMQSRAKYLATVQPASRRPARLQGPQASFWCSHPRAKFRARPSTRHRARHDRSARRSDCPC